MAQVFTGAKGLFKINDEVIAFVSGIDVNQDNELTDVDVMGQLEVGDLAETSHKVSFSVRLFKRTGELSGALAAGGNAENSSISTGIEVADLPAMRDQAYFECAITDNNGNEIYKMEDCKYQGGSGSVDARGVYQGTWNFKARIGRGL